VRLESPCLGVFYGCCNLHHASYYASSIVNIVLANYAQSFNEKRLEAVLFVLIWVKIGPLKCMFLKAELSLEKPYVSK